MHIKKLSIHFLVTSFFKLLSKLSTSKLFVKSKNIIKSIYESKKNDIYPKDIFLCTIY